MYAGSLIALLFTLSVSLASREWRLVSSQGTAADGNSTYNPDATPPLLYYEPPPINDYPRVTSAPISWTYEPVPTNATSPPAPTSLRTCPPCPTDSCPPPATSCYSITEPVIDIVFNTTSAAAPYTSSATVFPYPAKCSKPNEKVCNILDPYLNFGQPFQQCYDPDYYRCTPNGQLCPAANPYACGLNNCFKPTHRYQCEVDDANWFKSKLVFNPTLNSVEPYILCPNNYTQGTFQNSYYSKSTCSPIDSPIQVKKADNETQLMDQCRSLYVDAIRQEGCVVYNPHVNGGKAFVQCYNKYEYVCNDAQALCPIATPWVCGTTCFSLSEYRCVINGTDFYSSVLINAYVVPDSGPYLLCNRQPTPVQQGVDAQIVLNPVGKVTAAFTPYPINIKPGQTVVWKNNDVTTHTISSADPTDGSWTFLFDSGDVNPGDRFALTFPDPGTYYYGCRYTGFRRMQGQVIVK